MTESTKAIFLSYASQDAEAARRIGDALREAGLEVWFDQSELRGGDAWDEMIRRQIAECALFIPIISVMTSARLEGYFRLEWTLADQRTQRMARTKTFIVPVCVDATPESGSDVPESFVRVQWSRLPGGATPPAFIERVRSLLGADKPRSPIAVPVISSIPSAPAPLPASAATPVPRWDRRLLIGVAAAVLALAVLAWIRLWPPAVTSAPPPLSSSANLSPTAATAPLTIPEKSVAVLPFEDLSEKKDQAYFSDGLSAELIDLLAKIPGLRVPARTSSFYFKGKQATLQDIAHALSVTHVLEGTVRKSGQTLRVTTDLVRVDNGTPMWSESYDRKLDDVFKIQDEIAASVVGALKVSLLGGASPRATPTASPAAYTSFLQCQAAGRRANRDEIARAIQYCEQAVALDPKFAPGWLGLAQVLRIQFVGYGMSRYEEVRPRVNAAIQRALALDPNLPEAHYSLAQMLYQMDFDPAAADVELKRAIALDPNNAEANWVSGYIADIECRFDDSLHALERSRARDPLLTNVYIQMGNTNYRSGKLADAAAAYRTALGIDPGTGSVHYRLGLVALLQGDPSAALGEFEKEADPDFRAVGLPLAYDALGRKADADRAIAAAETSAAVGAAYQVALIHAARKETEKTFEWLNRAYRHRDAGMLWIKGEPLLKDVRNDPRFQVLLRQMHLA